MNSVVIAVWNIAVCDDERVMLDELTARVAGYMEEAGRPCRVSAFSSGSALLDSAGEFDLILLDVQMERPDGLETAKELRRRGSRAVLVFVTVLKERVFDAFEVEALDYLVKPLDPAQFRRTMDRAVKALDRRGGKRLVIQRGSVSRVIPLSELVYCEVQGRKIYLHEADGAVVDYYEKLDRLETRVDGRFFRCHRSYLVNLDFVRGCGGGRVALARGEDIPLSRLREREFAQALLRHMREREG